MNARHMTRAALALAASASLSLAATPALAGQECEWTGLVNILP